MRTGERYFAECFGVGWRSDIPLPGFQPSDPIGWVARGLHPIDVERIDRIADRPVTHTMPGERLRQLCDDGARVEWGGQATFDVMGGDRITYCPGPNWTGQMPIAFYATIAALTCAWRGDIPIHASTVEWQGKAIVVAGAAGAGKSSSISAMLVAGARLVGDDLTVMAGGTGPAMIRQGRPTVRLHPDTAALVPCGAPPVDADDSSGKVIVRPSSLSCADRLPLGLLVLLGEATGVIEPVMAVQAARGMLFRPRMQAAMPGHARALSRLMDAAANYPVVGVASPVDFTFDGLLDYGQRLLALAKSVDRPLPAPPPI